MWCPWWLRHGAMDPFEGTLLGECGRTELWIYTFNLVIRLRKVKQSAIRFCTIFSRSCCPCLPWDTSANPPLLKWSCTEQPETAWFLSQDRNSVDNMAFMDHGRLEATCFQVWPTFFWWFSGEVEHIVHPIRMNLNSRLMPTCGCDRLPSLRGSTARLSF